MLRRLVRPTTFVAIVGVLATFAFAYTVAKTPGVYWTRVQARFLAPDLDASNAYHNPPSTMVLAAAAVGRIMSDSDSPRMADADTTLVGEGVRKGYQVSFPNTGGQWANQFVSPFLDVQVVDSSPDVVVAKTRELLAQIQANLTWLQDEGGAAPAYRITIQISPITVNYSHGSKSRSGAIALLLGLGTTYAAVRFLRRDRGHGAHTVQHQSIKARVRNRSSFKSERRHMEDSELVHESLTENSDVSAGVPVLSGTRR